MSFGTYSRKVRDTALPFGRRVSALCSCAQLYRPLGFNATLSFLREAAGPYRRDEQALMRALDLLIVSRTGWQADMRAYAEQRRAAKRTGQRSPRPGEANPNDVPGKWYGAQRPAALHALRIWNRDVVPYLVTPSDVVGVDIRACVTSVLASNGDLTPRDAQLLATAMAELQRRVGTDLWRHDSRAYGRVWNLLRLARLVQHAAAPPT